MRCIVGIGRCGKCINWRILTECQSKIEDGLKQQTNRRNAWNIRMQVVFFLNKWHQKLNFREAMRMETSMRLAQILQIFLHRFLKEKLPQFSKGLVRIPLRGLYVYRFRNSYYDSTTNSSRYLSWNYFSGKKIQQTDRRRVLYLVNATHKP